MCARHSLRNAGDSRCCKPEGAPYRWAGGLDDGDASVLQFAEWLAGLPEHVQRDAVSRIEALRELARQGSVVLGHDEKDQLKAVESDPDMYELRWTLYTKRVRQYHAEPDRYPSHLIALHLHIKGDTVNRSWTPVRGQQEEIVFAKSRYRDA